MNDNILSENIQNSIGLIHKIYEIQRQNAKKYTASTKTKSEVRGGGKKPWRQKGTGNARAGSTRSPLWVGGGVIFGPKPRIVKKKANKKERKLAIFSAIYLKRKAFRVLDQNLFENFPSKKSKDFLKFCQTQGISLTSPTLFVIPKECTNFLLASRNIKSLSFTTWNSLSVTSLLKASHIVFSSSYLEFLTANYGSFSS
jgi:large subunit ribosomal protein L4